jgi:hypothetical protein
VSSGRESFLKLTKETVLIYELGIQSFVASAPDSFVCERIIPLSFPKEENRAR